MSVYRCRLSLALSLVSLSLLIGESAAAQIGVQKGVTQSAPGPVVPAPLPGPGTALPGDTIAGGIGEIDQPGTSQDPYAIPGAMGKVLGRTIVGHFNNDDWLDTIVMVAGEPIVLSGRDVYLSYDKPWASVLSMDTFPKGGPSGQDAVVFTDSAGLHVAWWDFTTKKFASQLVDASWANAEHVRVLKLELTSHLNVVAISPTRRSLLVLGATSATPPIFSPRTGFVSSTDIEAFETLEWDGAGSLELAMLVDQGLEIRSSDGSLIKRYDNLPTGGWLTSIHQGYLPYDRLTWVTPSVLDSDTQQPIQFVYTFDQNTIDIGVNTSGIYVSSVESTDWDGDGDDDLISAHGFSHDLIVLLNSRDQFDPLGTSFSAQSAAFLLPIGPPNTSNLGQVANVVVGDYDNDGDMDAGLAVASSSEFRIGTNEVEVAGADVPVITRMNYKVTAGSSTGDLKIRISRPQKVTSPVMSLQVVLWRQAKVKSPSEPTPVQTDEFSIARWPTEVTIKIPEQGQYFESTYYLEMRYGDRVAGADPIDYREASVGGFTLSILSVIELAKVTGTGGPLIVIPQGDLVFNPGEIGLLGGAYIPELRVPSSGIGFNYN